MIYRIFKHLINLFYPLRCSVCKQRLHPENSLYICRDCLHKIRLNLPPHCKRCGRTIDPNIKNTSVCIDCKFSKTYFDRVWSVCQYKNVIKECVYLFKYKKKFNLLNLFTKLMQNFIDHFIDMDKIDIITAVPMHKSKLRNREFNHSGVLVRKIAKRYKKKIIKNNLNKVKITPPQARLKRKQRLRNLHSAFEIKDKTPFKNKNVLLIDDVLTTGSTIAECAKVLKQAGVNKLYALALAGGS